jgi:diguanylate cyclase (GGDEF)-like protein/PAS domain S-box-containing protein
VEALLTKTMLLLRLDANGRVLEASPSDLVPVGTLLSDAVLPGDRAAVEAMLQAARRGEPAWGTVTLQRDSTLQRCDAACIPGEFGTSSWLLRPRAPAEDPLLDDEAELERWLGGFLIHEIEIGLLVFDHAALLRYRNAPAVRLLASRESELPLGTPWSVVVERLLDYFPSARAVIDALHASVADGRALHQLELERRDGAVLSLDYLPVHVGQATVAHVLRMRDITVRRRAERRAALAEQRYRDLVELVPVVVYRATAADTAETSYVSPQIERLLGYTPEEWLAERGMWRRHLHPEDRPWITAAIERAVREGKEFSLEYRMVRRDGSIVWVQDWGRVRTDESGCTFIHGVMLDITERKEAERARAEVEARLRALVETMPAVLYVCEPEPIRLPDGLLSYPFRYLNGEVAELTGYPVSQFLADPTLFARLIHPDDWGRYEAEMLRTDETGQLCDIDYRIVRRDGSVRWIRERAVQVRDATGQPLAWQGLLIDVTAQKETERALREAEERYRTLVEQLPGALLVVSAQPRWRADGTPAFDLIYVSPQIERLTGYPPAAWHESGLWMRLVYPDDRPHVLSCLERCLRERAAGTIEYRLVRADGRTVWIRHEAILLLDQDGEPLVWQSLLLDITAEKEAEAAQRESEERFRLLAEHHPGAVTIVEPEPVALSDGTLGWRILFVSPRIVDLTGYTAEEWSELGVWMRNIHPEDRERVLAEAERWYRVGPQQPLEYRFRHKDGRWVWLRQEGALVRDQGGRPRYLLLVTIDVTEQRQLLEQLREAELRYRTLVEQLPSVVLIRPLVMDREAFQRGMRNLYVSPAIERLTGFRPEEWTPERFLAQLHPDDRERVLAAITTADRTGESLDLEYRLLHKDGSVVWVWSISHVVRAADGTPLYRQILFTDITAHKLAEEALREAEERYRTLVEQLPGVVLIRPLYPDKDALHQENAYLYVSPAIEQLTGFRPEELTPRRYVEQVHPDDRERMWAAVSAADATAAPIDIEYRFIRKDGSVIWLWVISHVIRDAGGKPVYRQVLLLDITARKLAEHALREAEERYRTLVEQIPAAVIVTSAEPVVRPDGSLHYPVTFLSQRIEEVTGFSREEFLATPGLWFSRMHPDDQPRVFAEAVRTDETGEPFEAMYRFQRKDGRWVWLENRAVMVRNAEGKPLFWHGLLIDVTERKRAEELLLAQTTLLRLIAEAAPLSEILELLCHLVEQQAPGLRCSVLLLGSDDRLYHGAAPSLPPRYLAAIDGLPIGPQAGSCGTAAYLDRPIFVEDIASDPRWADYREAALEAGLRACWSTPIRGTGGNVLGTLALYAGEPRGPQPNEERLLELATQLAALALERWQESEELRHRAFHDPLTGLPNRLLFLDRLEHAVARSDRNGGGIAVLFLDLDDFKRVNDTWGHAVGDAVLQEVAARLSRQVRAGDTVARFAGDEFTVLLDGVTGERDVRVVTERLLAALASPIRCGEQEIRMGLSIGAAVATGRPMPDSGTLLLSADQALYAAKRRGKGCYEIVIAQPGSSQAERRSS